MAKLSVIVNVVDWEVGYLQALLDNLRGVADEIVLIDMTSSDKVERLAGEGIRVEKHEFVSYVEPVRNFAISKAECEWVLIMDPDEHLPGGLVSKIADIVNSNDSADYYRIPRKNLIFGKWIKHARWWPDYNIRLFKKGSVTWNEVIHSVPITYGKGGDLPIDEGMAIIHHHYDSIEQYIERLNRYTTQHAKLIKESEYRFSWKDLLVKPTEEFLSRYFFGKGYLDGLHGLALSLLQAFSELTVYLKVWQLYRFEDKLIPVESVIEEINKAQKNLNYWKADALLGKSGSMLQRIKRKFRLP